jgi:hypothetical protein
VDALVDQYQAFGLQVPTGNERRSEAFEWGEFSFNAAGGDGLAAF